MNPTRILFILKRRDGYGENSGCSGSYSVSSFSSGLANSVNFLVQMLNSAGLLARSVEVTDNNDIDREVTNFKPTHVVIEALWVVPEKFEVLSRLHPNVSWIVRLHSEIPFLANEGVAVDWIKRYVDFGNESGKLVVAANSPRALRDVQEIIKAQYDTTDKDGPKWLNSIVVYLPNWYPANDSVTPAPTRDGKILNIASFGAIRPFNNQLMQAIAAIRFADSQNKTLNFHINYTRQEQGGGNNFKNLEALFHDTPHQLLEHAWLSHTDFIEYLKTGIDIGMQVSFTETFSIVAADMVNAGLPVVVSSEIPWSFFLSYAEPTDSNDIFTTLMRVTSWPFRSFSIKQNLRGLKTYSKKAAAIWLAYFGNPKV